MLVDFYSVTAQICFALLGLWWVVVQFRHAEWLADASTRRRAYQISLLFLLPGVMSLASLASERFTAFWQWGFGLAGLIGLAESVRSIARPLPGDGTLMRAVGVISALLYLLITILAIAPTLPGSLGLDLKGREVESIAISLLIFLGATLVWRMLANPTTSPGSSLEETGPRRG